MNDEHKRFLSDCLDEIVKIKEWIDKNPMDTNVKFLVAYAVIKSSGTIEIVLKSILFDFLSIGCKPETQVFLEKNVIDSSCNPNTGNIERLLDQIDSARKTEFDNRIKTTQEKGELNSLVNLRNDIAHGRGINQTINTVKKYYESGIKIINILDTVLYKNVLVQKELYN